MAPPFTMSLEMGISQSSTNTAHQCPGVESSFVHFCKKEKNIYIHPTCLILLICPVCSEEDAVLLLGSFCQLPLLLLVLLLLRFWPSLPYNEGKREREK